MFRIESWVNVAIACTVVLCAFCAFPRGVVAGETEEREFEASIDLARLRSYALANNPDIEAAAHRWRAAQARPSQEGSLPDPMVNTAYHNEGFERLTQGTGDFTFLRFGAEQEVPFPGKLRLRESVAAREADREGAMYRATVLSVVTRLRIVYDDYYFAQKSIEIVGNSRELLNELTHVTEKRYQVGEGLQQDVARAQVELSILLGQLATLEQERQSAAAMVNAILNRPPPAPLGPPTPVDKVPFTYTLDQLEALATEQSPNVAAAQLAVVGAETKIDLAKRDYYPDFLLRADYFNKAALVPEWEVGAGIRVPLYFWRKQMYGVREAAARADEARASRRSTIQDVRAKLKDLHAQATTAARLIELYGNSVTPQAEVSLNSASAGYQVGKVDFITLLNNFTVLNDYRLRYYEELVKFDKAVAQIEETAGIAPPERDARESE
jgi:cobalt-zinc-cadmium efflux system outer membrane protein